MIPTRQDAVKTGQNLGSSAERLRGFMKTHDLTTEELAGLLSMPPRILEDWLNEDMTPPGCLIALMILLGNLKESRRELSKYSSAASGRSPVGSAAFVPPAGNGREEALKRVRAI